MSGILQYADNNSRVSYDPVNEMYTITLADGNTQRLSTQQMAQLPAATLQGLGLDSAAIQRAYQGPGSNQWAQSVQQSWPDDIAFWAALDHGTVVRWTMNRLFTYTALKVRGSKGIGARWYTSATEDNPTVGQILTTEELHRLLTQASYAIGNVEIAENWRKL